MKQSFGSADINTFSMEISKLWKYRQRLNFGT